jgi:tRNA (cmo5U34)-methyltransferase
MRETGSTPEQLARLPEAYQKDVAVLPLEQVTTFITSAGFESPVLFLQTCLIHAWHARRARAQPLT